MDGVNDYLLGAGGIGGIIWALYERFQRVKVDRAANDSSVSESRANETLFNMLNKRLETLETEIINVRKELDHEREYTRMLIAMMIKAGLEPPSYPGNY